MVFKKMKKALGASGASIDTQLASPDVYPGGVLTGQVVIYGGDRDVDCNKITLGLEARAEVETDDGEYLTTVRFAEIDATGPFELKAGTEQSFPMQFQVPIHTPLNFVAGGRLNQCDIGVRTELDIHRAIDKGDLDEINVHPLPSQARILQAFEALGFRFKSADFEKGRLAGNPLNFYQEIEFAPSPEFAGKVSEVEVTFITRDHDMDVLIELDKRGGFLSSGGDQISRFTVNHAEAETGPWEQLLQQHLHELGGRRGLF